MSALSAGPAAHRFPYSSHGSVHNRMRRLCNIIVTYDAVSSASEHERYGSDAVQAERKARGSTTSSACLLEELQPLAVLALLLFFGLSRFMLCVTLSRCVSSAFSPRRASGNRVPSSSSRLSPNHGPPSACVAQSATPTRRSVHGQSPRDERKDEGTDHEQEDEPG